MFFQLLSTLKVKLVGKMRQSTYSCVVQRVTHKKIPILSVTERKNGPFLPDFLFEILHQIKNPREEFHQFPPPRLVVPRWGFDFDAHLGVIVEFLKVIGLYYPYQTNK